MLLAQGGRPVGAVPGSMRNTMTGPSSSPAGMGPPFMNQWRPDQSAMMKAPSQDLSGTDRGGPPASGIATPLLEMSGMPMPQSPRPAHEVPATPGLGGSITTTANQSGCGHRILPSERVSRHSHQQGQPQHHAASQAALNSGPLHSRGALGSFVGTSARLNHGGGAGGSFIGAAATPTGAGASPQHQQPGTSQTGPVLPMPGKNQGQLPSSQTLLQFTSRGANGSQPVSSPQQSRRGIASQRSDSTERFLAELRQASPMGRTSHASPLGEPRGPAGPTFSSMPPLTPHLQQQVHGRRASPMGRCASPVARQATPLQHPGASPVGGRCASPMMRQVSPIRSLPSQYFAQAPMLAQAQAQVSPLRKDHRLRSTRHSMAAGEAYREYEAQPSPTMSASFNMVACCPAGHPLVALGTSRDDGWDCDARGEPGGCLSGITGFNQTMGMKRFRCDLCLYDLCERCHMARSRATMVMQQLKAQSSPPVPPVPQSFATPSQPGRTASPAATPPVPVTVEATPTHGRAVSPPHGRAVSPPHGRAASPHPKAAASPEAAMDATPVTPGGIEAPPAVPARTSATPRRVLCAWPGPSTAGTNATAHPPWGWQETGGATANAPAQSSQPRDLWSVDLTYRLEGTSDDIARLAGQVPLLDADVVCSVNQAVDGLNRGSLNCPEDFCVVYSASNQGWYLLHKRGKRQAALSQLGLHESQEKQHTQLNVGSVVQVGGCSCKVTAALGTGSFGTVWAAERLDGEKGEVAIKEILCRTPQERASAAFEGRLLEMLHTGNGPGTSPTHEVGMSGGSCGSSCDARDRIPDFVGTDTEPLGTDMWRVRLAMSRVPGVPLDRFLDANAASETSSPAQQQRCFIQACHFARELVLQLSPTFEHVATFAYHRDVNSHNILVDGDADRPVFGLVDFGLAVELSKWQGPMGSCSWHLVDIGGDCRYWPMSAWLQFECGWQELSKYPPLATEYQAQLDFHALGVTALQVLAAMSPRADSDGLPQELRALQKAWDQYWEDATRFWQRLLDVFRRGGDQNALKVACIAEGVHNTVGANLAALRMALREAYNACGDGDGLLCHARSLFAALLELVSAGGTVGFEEIVRPPSWQAVRALAATSDQPGGYLQGMAEPLKCAARLRTPGLAHAVSAAP